MIRLKKTVKLPSFIGLIEKEIILKVFLVQMEYVFHVTSNQECFSYCLIMLVIIGWYGILLYRILNLNSRFRFSFGSDH